MKKYKKNTALTNTQRTEWCMDLIAQNTTEFEEKSPHIKRWARRRLIKDMYHTIYRIREEYYEDYDTYFWEELPKPIFLHYKKSWRVRKELMNTPEYPKLKHICYLTTGSVTSRRRDFMEKNKKTKKRKVRNPEHSYLRTWEYEKLDDRYKKEFTGILSISSWGSMYVQWHPLKRWRWDEIKIEPVYARWRGIPNTKAIARHEELWQMLFDGKSKYYKRTFKALGWDSCKDYWCTHKSVRIANEKLREMKQELIEYESNKENII